ncbi:MAG: hypothetical protein RQ723_04400 [Desulfuromonadales bacterium]|nr:hypothetical protein [Desulfuromonadales bacterium]
MLAGVLAFTCTGYAQNIGPGVPAKNWPGNIATPNFGIGYHFSQAEWDGFDVEGQRIYAHFGAVFGDQSTPNYEVFLRLGAANGEVDNYFDLRDRGLGSEDFESDFEPMYAAGIKGEFYQGRVFGWGGVLQGLYINSLKDDYKRQIGGIDFKVSVDMEDYWELELGLPIHARIPNGLLYLGPVIYHSTADGILTVRADDGVSSLSLQTEENIDEDHNVGVFGGVVLRLDNVSLELEAKYKSDISAGALLTFTF